jgi:hypothetical protein
MPFSSSVARLLPPSFAEPRVSARLWIALAAGIGAGVCAYAGLYPRFDGGALRLVLALTSMPFAAAVVASSLSAATDGRAFGRALGYAMILGAASTIIPAALFTRQGSGDQFVTACIFGGFFGAITGGLYGLPLAVLSAAGQRHVRADTHESTDLAERAGGIWLLVVSLIGLAATHVLDDAGATSGEVLGAPAGLPAVIAGLGALGGLTLIVRATLRLRRRNAWIERVRSGLEPAFRTRVVDLRDRLEALPRLAQGATVVELVVDETSGAAYRVAAYGTAVALVSDPR